VINKPFTVAFQEALAVIKQSLNSQGLPQINFDTVLKQTMPKEFKK